VLSAKGALRQVLGIQMIVDLVVSTFLLNRPFTWVLQGTFIAVGAAIASRLPYLTESPLEALLQNLHLLQLVLLAAAAAGMLMIPAHERGGRGLAGALRDAIPPSVESPLRVSLSAYRAIVAATWETVVRRRNVGYWLAICALLPAVYAPTRLRMNADASWAAGVGTNSVVFAVARGVVNALFFLDAQRRVGFNNSTTHFLMAYFAIFVTVACCPSNPGESLVGAGIWVFLDAMFSIFVTAQSYACFVVAARLGGGSCAVVLLALQEAMFHAGDLAWTLGALYIADLFSTGCVAQPNQIRVCEFDALPMIITAFCAIGSLAACAGWYFAFGNFDIAENPDWGDAGKVVPRSRLLMLVFTIFFVVVTVVTAHWAFADIS
jgi:hypothetical protein